MSKLTIHDLGWTPEEAAYVRSLFGPFAEDWDDPAMDVYDDPEPTIQQINEWVEGIESGAMPTYPIELLWQDDEDYE